MTRAVAAAAAALAAVVALAAALLVMVSAAGDAPTTPAGVACAPAGWTPDQPIAGFTGDQLANAATIVAVGVEMAVPPQGQVIAVATAMQESTLNNVAHGDRAGPDSRGLFQQRNTWGPLEVRMDPQGAARLFYQALLAVSGWQQLPLTQAAQAVQNSGLPFEYAKWEDEARQVVGAVRGVVCPPTAPGSATAPNGPMVQTVIDRALATIGTPYVWGGGDADGPTRGVRTPAGRIPQGVGFDCSGLMLHAYAGIGVDVPHQTRAIWARFGPPITDRDALLPGDMILLSNNGRPDGIHHVGLYLGDARVVHSPRTNTTVTVVDNVWANSYWSGEFIGAVRAVPAAPPTTTTSPLLRAA